MGASALAGLLQFSSGQVQPRIGYNRGYNKSKVDTSKLVAKQTEQKQQINSLTRRLTDLAKKKASTNTQQTKDTKQTKDVGNDKINNLHPGVENTEVSNIEKIQPKASSENRRIVENYPEIQLLINWESFLKVLREALAYFVTKDVVAELKIKNDDIINYYKYLYSTKYSEEVYNNGISLLTQTNDRLLRDERILVETLYRKIYDDILKCKQTLPTFINPFAFAVIINQSIEKAKKLKEIIDNKELDATVRSNLQKSIKDKKGEQEYSTEPLPQILLTEDIIKTPTNNALVLDFGNEEITLKSWGHFISIIQALINNRLDIEKINNNINPGIIWKTLLIEYINNLKKDFEELVALFDLFANKVILKTQLNL
jgi:hypothetical protein